MIITLDIVGGIGAVVYLKTDKEQLPRMITAFTVRETGVIYELSNGTATSSHYGFEVSETKDILIEL